jgi:hypothetical protein
MFQNKGGNTTTFSSTEGDPETHLFLILNLCRIYVN